MAPPDTQDEDFASLLAEYDKSAPDSGLRRAPRVGEQVTGTIVSVGQDAVFVDLGAKSEGVLDVAELRDAEGHMTVAVGDKIEARVVDNGGRCGCIVLRRTLGRGPEARAEIEQAAEHGIPVEGVVAAVNKGGLEVTVAGMRAFCPISQIELHHVEDASVFVGQRFSFRITKYEPGPKGKSPNIVVSRRALLEEESRARAEELRAHLEVGAVLPGIVTSLRDYGAFVDLGGLEGMLHVSEIGFARVSKPSDVLAVGQRIEVQVKKIEKTDDPKRPERIALSLKSLERDPWEGLRERFPEGTRLRGTVVRVEAYGAFVEVAPGVEGLLHVSELGGERQIRHPREVVKPGEVIEVTVLSVDLERHRLSLSRATGTEEDGDVVSAAAAVPRSLGTLGDLLARKKR